MKVASIEVTTDCNLACGYCPRPRSADYMDLSVFRDVLSRCRRDGFDAIALGGGEPLLHPEIRSFAEMASAERFSVTLTTNATLPDLIPSCSALSSLSVSVGKGEWRAVLAGATRYPFPVTANVLLLRDGMARVKEYAADILRVGCNRLLFLSYKGGDRRLRPADEDLVRLMAFCQLLGQRFGAATALDAYTLRRLGLMTDCREGFVRYDVRGKAQPCSFPDCEYYPVG